MTMHGHHNVQQGKPAPVPVQEAATDCRSGRSIRKALYDDINKLCVCSRKGLWGLLIFLATSILVFYCHDQGLSSCISPEFREQLGPAPPVILVNILMGISVLSSLILIGGRISQGLEPGNTWMHLFFRLLFYPVYFVIDALSGYYHAVFISGLIVLALQHYNIWSYATKGIDKKMIAVNNLAVWQKRVSGK